MEAAARLDSFAGADLVLGQKGRDLPRVFAAVDDSTRAPEVVATALTLARRAHAAIRLYQAVAVPPEFPPAAATQTVDALPEYLHRASVARLNAFARGMPDLACDVEVEESLHPGESIVRAAARYEADLIVLGVHARKLVDRIVGTTTDHVVRAASCNVLVTRSAGAPTPARKSNESPFVLACLDASPAGPAILRAAAQMARLQGLELRGFRIVTGAGERSPSSETLIAEGVADLERVAHEASVTLAGAFAVVDEVAWRAICSTANGKAALVVVGAPKSGALRSLATTASHLVHHCDAPVLIVRLEA